MGWHCELAGDRTGRNSRALAGVGVIGDGVARLPICAGGDSRHRHGAGCLPVIVRRLPAAPDGWRWGYGATRSAGFGVWLERIGGERSPWHVVGLPTCSTVAGLVAVVEAYASGLNGGGLAE